MLVVLILDSAAIVADPQDAKVALAELKVLLQLAVTGQANGTRLPDLEQILPTTIPAVIALSRLSEGEDLLV